MSSASGQSLWLLAEELFERGDPAFVDALRQIDDAERLGAFAARWYADPRPTARQLLSDYLHRPLNAYHHEPLVKRLFKMAEAAGDDRVMGQFLVTFDRSLRRVRRQRVHFETEVHKNPATVQAVLARWAAEGADNTNVYQWGGQFNLYGRWSYEAILTPRGTTMPRGREVEVRDRWFWGNRRVRVSDLMLKFGSNQPPPASVRDLPEHQRRWLTQFRLFSVHTRQYLRRRAWRYFRTLAKAHPERYVPAVAAALKRYEDTDAEHGLALLDNWGLVHILFHHCPALVAKASGWNLAPGHTLAELAPAPAFEDLWRQRPQALLELVREARCRAVRQWAVRLLRRDPEAALAGLSLDERLELLRHPDEEVVDLAAEVLRRTPGLDGVGLARWLALLDAPSPTAVAVVCELMREHVRPETVTLAEAARLAASRPVPVARLGLAWLQTKRPESEADCQVLLRLVEAESEPVRGEIVRWARGVLIGAAAFRSEWVLEYLDSRHVDVRAEGWTWLQEEPRAREDVELWRRLLESPYDDVRLNLVADLEKRAARPGLALTTDVALDPALIRFLWAAVLLNIHRGGRTKPVVVRQIVRRLAARPQDASDLLPILGVALRSVRGPEWRAGLAGVVQLIEQNPELAPAVRASFPELTWE